MACFLYEVKKVATWAVLKNQAPWFVTFEHFSNKSVVYTRQDLLLILENFDIEGVILSENQLESVELTLVSGQNNFAEAALSDNF
jgi:hypothetical protein